MLWVYRCGWTDIDRRGRRFLFSQTAACTLPEDGTEMFNLAQLATECAVMLRDPVNPAPIGGDWFATRIYPTFKVFRAPAPFRAPRAMHLNDAAPEAALRLQRVGAGGAIGRTLYPITEDSWFVDRPHRRRVNVPLLQPRLDAWAAAWPNPWNPQWRPYWRCVFNRRAITFDPVVTYRILVNPVRRWQRWRPYLNTGRDYGSDVTFAPNEAEHF